MLIAAWSTKEGKVHGLEKINLLAMWGEKTREHKVEFLGYMIIVATVTMGFFIGLAGNMCVMRRGGEEDWVISICPIDQMCIPEN